jgi:hypothetical protein
MARVKVRSKKEEGHRIITASGVWGGVTPHGMIYFDMFIEKPEAPAETMITIDERTGERTETVETPSEPYVERLLVMGVMVRPEIARSIGQWLTEKADEAELLGHHQTGAPRIVQ